MAVRQRAVVSVTWIEIKLDTGVTPGPGPVTVTVTGWNGTRIY
jgi:hypothetical protein